MATGTTEDGVRTAAAEAIHVAPERVELRGDDFIALRNPRVGGGEGRVCVNGAVDGTGHAKAEVLGRTADGSCLPGLGAAERLDKR
ncbi:hypothetical protein OG909_23045 [Streptomyces sp. NBC_01754]|uniref:hypothetical protein n=1 Tax=Streptomyces sp. NBC_01754 TaxID=2975930 RepID=UPI002DDC181C|nr:hypothetical protein [Streptomyces sp. NBC_01754]WSC94918.1 hypothetical protein OG909_23045 [Streptomyces sp. NBC_01754]